jgi:hypothetical protein
MDIVDLSLKMKRLVQWLDSQRPLDRFIRKRFDGPPFGNCYVTIDPDRQARFASGNMNRVYLCGAEPGMDSDSIRHIIDLFAAEGIGRFFVWLSPGPGMDAVRGWLEASGLTRVQWTGYPTLCRSVRICSNTPGGICSAPASRKCTRKRSSSGALDGVSTIYCADESAVICRSVAPIPW